MDAPQDLNTIEENKQLLRENKRLQRELERQRTINQRNQISAEAKANLSQVVSAEKSRLEQYMNLLLGNCPDSILLFDSKGQTVYASDSYLRHSHAPAVSLIRGQTLPALLKPVVSAAFLAEIEASIQRVLSEKQRVEVEQDIDFAQGGNLRHYIIQLTPMLEESGEVAGAMAILYDTTDLTRARDEAERARQLAEQSTRAKSDFLSRMSHEMRTPLNAIIGMSNIGQRTDDMERVQYALTKVNEASKHLLGVINDILDISKIEADKFELYDDEFSFEHMLQRVVTVNHFRVEEKSQELSVFIDPTIPETLIGDEQRLAQVITNLLSNAVKFTGEEGTIAVDACLERVEGEVYTLRISVTDSGIGISAEQQARLFSNFEQADGSISRKYGGTGLGLAISKRIVEMMGGRIWVDSKSGQGATFSVELPLTRGKDTSHGPLRRNARWDTLRVLVVDSTPQVQAFFSDLRQRYHIVCDIVGDGQTALEHIRAQGPYDIAFVDRSLPDMDGIALARQIKGLDASCAVMLLSPSSLDAASETAEAAGIDKVLPKPLFPSNIVDSINGYLGVSEQAAPQDSAQDSFAGFRVLLAEDVEINREIVMSLLEPTALAFDCAENGKEAVEMFTAHPDRYDLVFMDIQMPEMDGYEATQRIRALEGESAGARHVPIIAMTANAFREDIEKCLAAGMDGHVAKPMDLEDVLRQLRKYLLSGGSAA